MVAHKKMHSFLGS